MIQDWEASLKWEIYIDPKVMGKVHSHTLIVSWRKKYSFANELEQDMVYSREDLISEVEKIIKREVLDATIKYG